VEALSLLYQLGTGQHGYRDVVGSPQSDRVEGKPESELRGSPTDELRYWVNHIRARRLGARGQQFEVLWQHLVIIV
jgi:hypothetical protein